MFSYVVRLILYRIMGSWIHTDHIQSGLMPSVHDDVTMS